MKPNTAPPRRICGTTRPPVAAARLPRREPNPAERVPRGALHGRQRAGSRCRNQHAVGPFVADFVCPSANLIIEVDGGIHDQQAEQDAARTDYPTGLGHRAFRRRNEAIPNDLPAALACIEEDARGVLPDQRQRRKPGAHIHPQDTPETPPR